MKRMYIQEQESFGVYIFDRYDDEEDFNIEISEAVVSATEKYEDDEWAVDIYANSEYLVRDFLGDIHNTDWIAFYSSDLDGTFEDLKVEVFMDYKRNEIQVVFQDDRRDKETLTLKLVPDELSDY